MLEYNGETGKFEPVADQSILVDASCEIDYVTKTVCLFYFDRSNFPASWFYTDSYGLVAVPDDASPSKDTNLNGKFVFIYENEPIEKLLYADYINDYDNDAADAPFDGYWNNRFANFIGNATLIWNTPARSNTGWRFDSPAA